MRSLPPQASSGQNNGPAEGPGHAPSNQEPRAHRRAVVDAALRSNLGRVIDCSMSGARVVARRPPRGEIAVLELGDEHGSFSCAARVVWTRRCGLLRHEIGFVFPPLDEASAAVLRRLLATHPFSSEYGQAA